MLLPYQCAIITPLPFSLLGFISDRVLLMSQSYTPLRSCVSEMNTCRSWSTCMDIGRSSLLLSACISLRRVDGERLFFDRGPHGRVVCVPQHALNVVGVRRVDRLLILHRQKFHSIVNEPFLWPITHGRAGTERRTRISNPTSSARAFTCSKSSSIDGSVPLFSQCHNRGPRFKICPESDLKHFHVKDRLPRLIQMPPGAKIL